MAKAKVVHSDDGVNVLVEGNKRVRAEPSTHVISFPGGHLEVSRTSNDEYWAHIYIHRDGQVHDKSHIQSKRGTVVDSRIGYIHPNDPNVVPVPNQDEVNHIALKVRTKNV